MKKSWLIALTIFMGANITGDAKAIDKHDQLKNTITRWAEEQNFNGVLVVGIEGEPAITVTRGVADFSTKRPFTRNTIFQTGSVDKYLTAIAVLAMQDKGLLDIHTPITRYLPDYRSDTGDKVTLHHMLINRSGLPNDYMPPVGKIPAALKANPGATMHSLGFMDMSPEEGVKAYGSGDLKFTPGEQFDYSNTNWILLQHILRTVSGKSYGEVLQEYVFSPAGMENSGTFEIDLNGATPKTVDIAIGYNPRGKRHDGDYPFPSFVGHGSYMAAADSIKLIDALYSGKLLTATTLKEFSTVYSAEKHYAYGGRVYSSSEMDNQYQTTEPLFAKIAERFSPQNGSNGATKIAFIHPIGTPYTVAAFSNTPTYTGNVYRFAAEIILNLQNKE
ncbi:beta-lactamase family protein [Kordiimonas sp. SCSIO 12603]|uniref:serine hydrolase domain-containing protein n=1 Tax=Kordiimonas sp. SCSIO 12603 TaxID=2829596 RepID=UPI002104F044|nr:serine hydrolase domain-containing protein [Kordiimonas sp. SCSIO 12603]UTW59896.1 beta-lactamase family protein [Kordiimonas sp. SCSIO 12603]